MAHYETILDGKVDQKLLTELFDYIDGNLVWKVNRGRLAKSGQVAGHLDEKAGYIRTCVKGKLYLLHRLIYLYHFGIVPDCIDHINGNPLDNRIENLREASKQENCLNRGFNKNNTSGVKNVSWHKGKQKWGVSITVYGKKKHLGDYEDLELAELIAEEARNKFYGSFARTVQ